MNRFNGKGTVGSSKNYIKLFNMIFLMIGEFEPFTLFKVVNKRYLIKDSIKEEMYCIKCIKEPLIKEEIYCIKEPYKEFRFSYKKKYFTYYAIFKNYDYVITRPFFDDYNTRVNAYFEHADSTYSNFVIDEDSQIVIYRSVTKEEYYSKLKEKYDRKCLNIILKRLVDETFQSEYL
jgi:hypothetical protein